MVHQEVFRMASSHEPRGMLADIFYNHEIFLFFVHSIIYSQGVINGQMVASADSIARNIEDYNLLISFIRNYNNYEISCSFFLDS